METNFLSQATLLYVEDEEPIREFLQLRLSKKVNELLVAKNGQEGYELYCKHTPDLVLTDVTMPLLDGITMSRQIKEHNPQACIIIMSAHSDTSYLLDAIELGISHYLLKPIDKNKLYSTLELSAQNKFLELELSKKRRQMLHQSRFALLGEMTSMLAHQWRQPLNTISLSITQFQLDLEMKKFDLDEEIQRKEFLSSLNSSFKTISSYVQDLSKLIDCFARTYTPSDKLTNEDLNNVLKTAVEDFKNSISYDEIKIYEDYSSTKICPIYINEFTQICLNLLNNAKEHFQEREVSNPHIIISTHNIKDGVVVEIFDNAGGIDQEIISKIFDPYFSTKVGQNGNGLGLYMSKLIIEEHLSGKILVKNEEDGAKFSIVLKEVS